MDGDPPAAERYTEAKMARLSDELLADIDKETVDFMDTYDGSRQEPSVLPAKFPPTIAQWSNGYCCRHGD